jgi:uracil-DNA glycosylase family 4
MKANKYFLEPTNCTHDGLCPSFQSCPQMPSQFHKFGKKCGRVFFVFESPTSDDLVENAPMTGGSGNYFRSAFLNPFNAESGGISYVVSCLIRNPLVTPEGKARNPLSAEKAYCSDIFWEEVNFHKPEVFVVFGANAFNAFYVKCENRSGLPEITEQTVSKLRGQFYEMDFGNGYKPKVLVSYNPAFIVTNPASARFFEEDRNRLIAYFKPLGQKAQIINATNSVAIDKIDLIETVKDTLDFFDFLYRGLPEKTDLVFDTETMNLHRTFNNKFLTWQFTYKPGHAVVIPIEHELKPLFADIQNKLALIDAFSKILNSSPEQTRIQWIIGHNLKFDFGLLYGLLRILPKGTIPLWDTLLGMHWLDENRKGMGEAVLGGKPYALKTLGKEIFKFEYKSEQLAARSEGELGNIAFEELVDYAGTDTILTGCLKLYQEKMATDQNASASLEKYLKFYYTPAIRALAMTECNGLFVRKKHLAFLQGKDSPIWPRLEKIESVEIQNSPEVLKFRKNFKNELLGEEGNFEDIWGNEESEELPPFNMNKKVHEELLYLNYLKLRPLKVSKKTEKPSFNKEFLKHYAEPDTYNNLEKIASYKKYYLTPLNENDDEPNFPLNPLQMILEYRELKKMGTTYSAAMEARLSDPLGECIDSRIRGSFNLSGTDTGRLSASNPNLQQLPGRSKVAKAIKNMFQAEPPSRRFPQGTVLIQLDYKAAEMRWAAVFAKDKNLIRLFNEAYDSLKKACDPNSEISEEEFKTTQLAADIHRRTASLMYNIDPAQVKGDQRQASKCVIGSSVLFTNQGIKRIEDLVPNPDENLWVQPLNIKTASFEKPVSSLAINHKWVDKTIELKTSTGISIEGDKTHSLLVWKECEIIEKTLNEIEIGDLLILSKNNEIWPSESPLIAHSAQNEIIEEDESLASCCICGYQSKNLTSHVRFQHCSTDEYMSRFPNSPMVAKSVVANRMNSLLGSEHNIFVPKSPDKMTIHLAKILGYLVAEGCGQSYTMSGNIYKSKEMLADFIFCFNNCFGLSLQVSEYLEYTTTGIIRLPKKIVRFLLNLGLIQGSSETQRVPEIIFRSTREEVIAFLKAYFEGEGTTKQSHICVTSASLLLMKDIQILLLNLNICSILFSEYRITPVGKEKRLYYGLRLNIRDARLFCEKINFISEQKQLKTTKLLKTSSGRDFIYGLETLLAKLKVKYKWGRRWIVGEQYVRFGDRITKGNKSEITHELLASRPWVMNALKIWSEFEKKDVYANIEWLHRTKSFLTPVINKLKKNKRVKVYDIEVDDPKHTFVCNGFLSKNCITFGLLFGMSVKTLGNNNGWDEDEAVEKVNQYFAAFPQLQTWLENAKITAKKKGYVETLMGRRRRLQNLFATNDFRNENKALRLAMNAPIQGQSSDAGMLGVCVLVDYLLRNSLEKRWLIENVVHDSCLIQVPFEDIEKALPILQWCFVEGMADYLRKYFNIDLPLPIECEFEMGIRYGDLNKWDGRPNTLQQILSELKEKANKLWGEK